jgi:hypothetical protein
LHTRREKHMAELFGIEAGAIVNEVTATVEKAFKAVLRFRAVCTIHRACGSGMIPAMCTSRVARRMTKKTW